MKKIYLDLDNTVMQTTKAIVDIYNDDFSAYSNFKYIDYRQVHSWYFDELELCDRDYINNLFNQPRFFRIVKMFPNAKEKIDELSNKYKIVFVSMCYYPNKKLKEIWVKENFPYAKFISVDFNKYLNKSHIDMSDGIAFIDDSVNNLKESNCSRNICFDDGFDYNNSWKGEILTDWRKLYV